MNRVSVENAQDELIANLDQPVRFELNFRSHFWTLLISLILVYLLSSPLSAANLENPSSSFCYKALVALANALQTQKPYAKPLHMRFVYLKRTNPDLEFEAYTRLASQFESVLNPQIVSASAEETRGAIDRARVRLQQDSQKFDKHIAGIFYDDTMNGRRLLDGGLHILESWKKEIQGRVPELDLPASDYNSRRAFIGRYLETYCKSGMCPAKMVLLGMAGLARSDSALNDAVKHFDDTLESGPSLLPNGVLRVQFTRDFLSRHSWKQSVAMSSVGQAPLGAKTFFPGAWSAIDIREAVVSILRQPSAELRNFKLSPTGEVHQGVVVGVFDDVEIAVSIRNGEVTSAYPTWLQRGTSAYVKTRSLGSLISQWNGRIHDLYQFIESQPEFGVTISGFSPDDLMAIRGGESPAGHDLDKVEKARRLLRPLELGETGSQARGDLILKLFHLREVESRLLEYEAVLMRVRP